MRIGLISDTHGLLRPAALDFLAGSDRILHAGDIGDAAILEALARLAPVSAVRGNNDTGAWARGLPETLCLQAGGVGICLHHDRATLAALPAGTRVLVTGHSHRPRVRDESGVLQVNPGSAGRRRFRLPLTVAELRIGPDGLAVRVLDLGVEPPAWHEEEGGCFPLRVADAD